MNQEESFKLVADLQDTRRTALFNCIHRGIKFGAPNKGKPNYELWEPLLPSTPLRFYKICK